MLFYKQDGTLIEILRKNYISDKQYYNAILKAYSIILNKKNIDNYNNIKNIITTRSPN